MTICWIKKIVMQEAKNKYQDDKKIKAKYEWPKVITEVLKMFSWSLPMTLGLWSKVKVILFVNSFNLTLKYSN